MPSLRLHGETKLFSCTDVCIVYRPLYGPSYLNPFGSVYLCKSGVGMGLRSDLALMKMVREDAVHKGGEKIPPWGPGGWQQTLKFLLPTGYQAHPVCSQFDCKVKPLTKMLMIYCFCTLLLTSGSCAPGF